jgi:hypothetical protein
MPFSKRIVIRGRKGFFEDEESSPAGLDVIKYAARQLPALRDWYKQAYRIDAIAPDTDVRLVLHALMRAAERPHRDDGPRVDILFAERLVLEPPNSP